MTMQTFICEHCGETFTSARSEEDAEAEMMANWGPLESEDRSVICDDCYQQFMEWARERRLVRDE